LFGAVDERVAVPSNTNQEDNMEYKEIKGRGYTIKKPVDGAFMEDSTAGEVVKLRKRVDELEKLDKVRDGSIKGIKMQLGRMTAKDNIKSEKDSKDSNKFPKEPNINE